EPTARLAGRLAVAAVTRPVAVVALLGMLVDPARLLAAVVAILVLARAAEVGRRAELLAAHAVTCAPAAEAAERRLIPLAVVALLSMSAALFVAALAGAWMAV